MDSLYVSKRITSLQNDCFIFGLIRSLEKSNVREVHVHVGPNVAQQPTASFWLPISERQVAVADTLLRLAIVTSIHVSGQWSVVCV